MGYTSLQSLLAVQTGTRLKTVFRLCSDFVQCDDVTELKLLLQSTKTLKWDTARVFLLARLDTVVQEQQYSMKRIIRFIDSQETLVVFKRFYIKRTLVF